MSMFVCLFQNGISLGLVFFLATTTNKKKLKFLFQFKRIILFFFCFKRNKKLNFQNKSTCCCSRCYMSKIMLVIHWYVNYILFSSLLENANVHCSSVNQSIKINHHYYNSNFLYNHQCDQKFVIQYYNVKKFRSYFKAIIIAKSNTIRTMNQ